MLTGRFVMGAGIFCLGFGGYLYFKSAPAPARAAEGRPAPDLKLSDLSGRQASIEEYRGKIVLVDFWATWCEACKEEMPDLKRLYQKLRPQGVEFLAPSMDEDGKKALLPFVAQFEVPWRVLLANDEAARAYGVFGLPTKFLIDPSGVIVRRYVGPVEVSELERDVLSLLKKENNAS